jgi:hypothetical protein
MYIIIATLEILLIIGIIIRQKEIEEQIRKIKNEIKKKN